MSFQNLVIKELADADGWKDIARIPKKYRRDMSGNHISRGSICEVKIRGKCKLLQIRGWDIGADELFLDLSTRLQLGVKLNERCEVELRKTNFIGYWRWVWNAADPAYRIMAQISLISFFLGIVGLLLGIWSVIEPLLHKHPCSA